MQEERVYKHEKILIRNHKQLRQSQHGGYCCPHCRSGGSGLRNLSVLLDYPFRLYLQPEVQCHASDTDRTYRHGHDRYRQQYRAVPRHGGCPVHHPLPYLHQGQPGYHLHLLDDYRGYLLRCGRLCGGGCRQLRRISGAASVRPCPQRKSNAADHPGAAR